MPLVLDHFFIFVSPGFPEQDDVLFKSIDCQVARNHKGQGTENRCALFEANYLEFIWVNNDQEAAGVAGDLLKRSKWRSNGCCPFGICFRNSMKDITSESNIELYKPDYLRSGKIIELCKTALNPMYPDTFAIPLAQRPADREDLKEIDFEHPVGHLEIKIANITYPETNSSLDPEYAKSIVEKVSFTKGKSWHADLLIQTTSKEHHESVVHSTKLPVSLYLYYDKCPDEWRA